MKNNIDPKSLRPMPPPMVRTPPPGPPDTGDEDDEPIAPPLSEEERRASFKGRIAIFLARMRSQSEQWKSASRKDFSTRLGCNPRQIFRAETGANLSFEMVDLYEKACGDRLLVFLESEHSPECKNGSDRYVHRELQQQILVHENKIASLDHENAKLRGQIKRYERVIKELRAAGVLR